MLCDIVQTSVVRFQVAETFEQVELIYMPRDPMATCLTGLIAIAISGVIHCSVNVFLSKRSCFVSGSQSL